MKREKREIKRRYKEIVKKIEELEEDYFKDDLESSNYLMFNTYYLKSKKEGK